MYLTNESFATLVLFSCLVLTELEGENVYICVKMYEGCLKILWPLR